MNTNVISLDEFNARSGKNWEDRNACEFHGIIPGYVCGFNLEVEKDGIIEACSTCFTNDYDEIRTPWEYDDWNSLGICLDGLRTGWKPTGNIVFRGYHTVEYDFDEREEYYLDASDEVKNLWSKYVC